MNRLYIINPEKFSGSVENTMSCLEGTPQFVDYLEKPMTFEEYNKMRGGNLVALEFDEFYEKYYKPHLESLQGPWKEIDEKRYEWLLECLPPMRWTRTKEYEFFYMMEAYTADLHTFVVRRGAKYYEALRSKHIPKETLLSQTDDL